MLEPPAIPEAAIAACLRSEYGLDNLTLAFLPLGADLATAVFRMDAAGGAEYFAKLRFGPFDEVSALVPRWLAEQGIAEVMAPLPTRSGRPWAVGEGFTLLLYPYVEGRDAYEHVLSDAQWVAFGRAMRRIHDAPLPAALVARIARESYPSRRRDQLRRWMARIREPFADPVARRLSSFLAERESQVLDLVDRTQRLAEELRRAAPPFVLCHTDLHAGNLLLAGDGRLFIVDWDAPLLAPPERDLMYPGGGQGFLGRSPDEEERLFFEGYGGVRVERRALAYYRLERIVEDLAIFCEQLLNPVRAADDSAERDREQALVWAMSNFAPGRVLEIADRTLPADGS